VEAAVSFMLRRIALLTALSATAVSAQTPGSAQDSAGPGSPTTVTSFSIKSGKLLLASAGNPKGVTLPDGTYTNESQTILVIINGSITRVQQSTGEIVEIASARVTRQNQIRLTPSTNALMAVSEMPMPSGTFTSDDGHSSFTILLGRPTAFTLASGPSS